MDRPPPHPGRKAVGAAVRPLPPDRKRVAPAVAVSRQLVLCPRLALLVSGTLSPDVARPFEEIGAAGAGARQSLSPKVAAPAALRAGLGAPLRVAAKRPHPPASQRRVDSGTRLVAVRI